MVGLTDAKDVIPAVISCFDEEGNFDDAAKRNLTRFLINARGIKYTGATHYEISRMK